MAELAHACAIPGCARTLAAIPGLCVGCGTFWGSVAQLEQARRPSAPPGPARLPAPQRTSCIEIGAVRVAIPDNTVIVLGREPDWEQIKTLFDGQPDEAVNGVSRQHATITVVGDEARIVDLGSTNGTWVGGKDVTRSPAVKTLPVSLVLGLPDVGVTVTVRSILRGEPVSEWTGGLRRV
jgi:hypothetical protein